MADVSLSGVDVIGFKIQDAAGTEVDITDELDNTDVIVTLGQPLVERTTPGDEFQNFRHQGKKIGTIEIVIEPRINTDSSHDVVPNAFQAIFVNNTGRRTFELQWVTDSANNRGYHLSGTLVIDVPRYVNNPETGSAQLQNIIMRSAGSAWTGTHITV